MATLEDCVTFMYAVSPNISLLKQSQPQGDNVTKRDIIEYTIQNAVLEGSREPYAGEDDSIYPRGRHFNFFW